MPRSKIYKTLQKLIERGLVIEIPEEPRVYAPTSPLDAFKPFLESLDRRKSDLESTISLLERVFEKKRLESDYSMETMWIIQGQSRILRKIQEMMARAKGTVEIVSTEEMLLPVYKKCNKLFDQLSVRRVRVKVRVPADSPNSYFIRELKYICKVEKVNVWSRMVFINVDQKEFLLAKLTDKEASDSEGNNIAVYSNNTVFCRMLSTLLSDVIGRVKLMGKRRKSPLIHG